MAGALQGIKVLELGHWGVIPMGTALMADCGADVIKLENPKGGDWIRGFTSIEGISLEQKGIHVTFELMNRGKRGMAIDLKRKEGRQIVYDLVKGADVFATNYQQDVLEQLHMTYETLSKLNRGLVYAHLTAFGKKGPEGGKPGFDYSAYWARSGVMGKLAAAGGPPSTQRPAYGDSTTAMMVAGGIAMALVSRGKTGEGQQVDVSLLGTGIWTSNFDLQIYLMSGQEFPNTDRQKARNPLWNTYQTKDGRWMQLVMVISDVYWGDFCQAVGLTDLERDPRYDSHARREQNRESLLPVIAKTMASKTLGEWEQIFDKRNLPTSRVATIPEVANDRQAHANGHFQELDHPIAGKIKLVAAPVQFSKTPAHVAGPAPQLGQHTEEILLEMGKTWDDIARLKEQGVIP
ncbi:MAG: CoA transferase [Dehalococcoidia bacterium]|nr:CoA transferase [Dehalococcoidia bacterium]